MSCTVATPLALVVAVTVFVPPVNVPLGPVVGAVNVTTAPLTGFWSMSKTVAPSGENGTVTVALCGVVPIAAVIDAAAPAVFVRPKLAGAVAPVAEAVTI
jgi:hypothetical protein